MAKLFILAAVLVALLALGRASAHRTTITTTVVEEENTREPSQQRCREQIQRQQQLQHCQRYLSQRSQYGLAMVAGDNPQQEQQHFQQCCQQLQNIDEQCRCEAVRQVVREQQRQQQEGRGRRSEKMQTVVREAENLPSRCNLSPRRCQVQTQEEY